DCMAFKRSRARLPSTPRPRPALDVAPVEVGLEGAEVAVAAREEDAQGGDQQEVALGAEPEADCERERRDARDLVVHLVIADAEGKREPVGVRAALRGEAEVLYPEAERREEIEAHEDEKPVAEWRPEYGPGREGSGPGGRDAPAVTRVSLARAVEAVGDRHELVERVEEPRAHEEALAERTPVGVAGAVREGVVDTVDGLEDLRGEGEE